VWGSGEREVLVSLTLFRPLTRQNTLRVSCLLFYYFFAAVVDAPFKVKMQHHIRTHTVERERLVVIHLPLGDRWLAPHTVNTQQEKEAFFIFLLLLLLFAPSSASRAE
jgi:hypothetical protein